MKNWNQNCNIDSHKINNQNKNSIIDDKKSKIIDKKLKEKHRSVWGYLINPISLKTENQL
jgi:hypothetical protein